MLEMNENIRPIHVYINVHESFSTLSREKEKTRKKRGKKIKKFLDEKLRNCFCCSDQKLSIIVYGGCLLPSVFLCIFFLEVCIGYKRVVKIFLFLYRLSSWWLEFKNPWLLFWAVWGGALWRVLSAPFLRWGWCRASWEEFLKLELLMLLNPLYSICNIFRISLSPMLFWSVDWSDDFKSAPLQSLAASDPCWESIPQESPLGSTSLVREPILHPLAFHGFHSSQSPGLSPHGHVHSHPPDRILSHPRWSWDLSGLKVSYFPW